MPRGHSMVTKVHYRGKEDDFIVFVDSAEDVKKWRGDRSVPLAQVASNFNVYVTGKQGAQGVMDRASKSSLENEFNTKNEDEAIMKILEAGEVQQAEATPNFPGRGGDRNETQGPRQAH